MRSSENVETIGTDSQNSSYVFQNSSHGFQIGSHGFQNSSYGFRFSSHGVQNGSHGFRMVPMVSKSVHNNYYGFMLFVL